MIVAVDVETAGLHPLRRVTPEGGAIWRRRYFGPDPSPPGSASVDPKGGATPDFRSPDPAAACDPQAFLVDQEPGAVVHPHFHHVDQFQVAVAGSGTLGKHALHPLAVHFAGAYTGYGPIRPGGEGLTYLTARARADGTGAQFLPGARARMRAGPRRNRTVDGIPVAGAADLARRTETTLETHLAEDDGLTVWYLRVAPGSTATLPAAEDGDGQTLWLAAGTLAIAGAVHGERAVMFVSRDEPAPTVIAGAGGAELLIMQYPRFRSWA